MRKSPFTNPPANSFQTNSIEDIDMDSEYMIDIHDVEADEEQYIVVVDSSCTWYMYAVRRNLLGSFRLTGIQFNCANFDTFTVHVQILISVSWVPFIISLVYAVTMIMHPEFASQLRAR